MPIIALDCTRGAPFEQICGGVRIVPESKFKSA